MALQYPGQYAYDPYRLNPPINYHGPHPYGAVMHPYQYMSGNAYYTNANGLPVLANGQSMILPHHGQHVVHYVPRFRGARHSSWVRGHHDFWPRHGVPSTYRTFDPSTGRWIDVTWQGQHMASYGNPLSGSYAYAGIPGFYPNYGAFNAMGPAGYAYSHYGALAAPGVQPSVVIIQAPQDNDRSDVDDDEYSDG